MLDIKRIRKDLDNVCAGLSKRGYTFDVARFKELDAARKRFDVAAQDLQAERKRASKQVGELIKQGISVDDAKTQVDETLQRIGAELETLQSEAKKAGDELEHFLLSVPNVPSEEVPSGNDEDDNVEISRWGEPRVFDFEPRDHVDLGEQLNALSFDNGAKIASARFNVMSGKLAKLHRALAQFMLDTHTEKHGYQEVNVPLIVNRQSLVGTGQLPKFEEDLFKLTDERGFYLIPTAEVPVTNIMRDEICEQLPVKFTCHSACFRSEAGSHGRDTRGMIRQHQFEKVELVQFVEPDQSEAALEELTANAEAILQALELPYKKVILCGGDVSFTSYKTYDLEVWLPGQDKYREISSCSNFQDYQARRMMARYRKPDGSTDYVHTLNGSGLAVGRTLVAVLENYQQANGSVKIPAVLQPYMGGVEVLTVENTSG